MKIFGIGLSKTGTQSLAVALRMLGFSVQHYPENWEQIWQHDAAVDIPVAMRYRYLDRVFPDAKFILTTREIGAWLESCRGHFSPERESWRGDPPETWTPRQTAIAEVETAVYGTWCFDPDLWRRAYGRQSTEAREHFGDRPGKLLELDICGGDGWGRLMKFLGIDAFPFPWENRSLE